jgi:nicotinate-nucleotide adenylyltransferase
MKIGLYFGSFNPVHVGHLIIASHLLNETDLEKVWFVVSPQNPFKQENGLLNEYHRLHLVKLATEQDNRIKASEIEFGLPKPSYTINTLAYLAEKFPDHEFSIIMGVTVSEPAQMEKRGTDHPRLYFMYTPTGFPDNEYPTARVR